MFDWNDFRILAEELRQSKTEAVKRTAISRVYYAVYWKARNFLESEGFAIRQFEGSHIQIWNQYKQKSGQTNKAVGRFGSELHRFRVQADYISEIKSIESLTEDSFQLADKIMTYLRQIENQ